MNSSMLVMIMSIRFFITRENFIGRVQIDVCFTCNFRRILPQRLSERTWRYIGCASTRTTGQHSKRDLPGGGQILAFEFLTTNPDDRRLGPTRPNPKWHAFQVPRSQAHDRSIESLIDPTMRLLFIAAIVAPVVREHFLLQDCVIEHCFACGEKPRECEVDCQCQGELYGTPYAVIRQD